jgi:hypothetical protein
VKLAGCATSFRSASLVPFVPSFLVPPGTHRLARKDARPGPQIVEVYAGIIVCE